ncbi:hypothetical protein VTJ04DRAFT_2024 [Mycothermus thermophilus]|jgi:predicted membrane channel-forming protein YqfA (hemolysin III family)|uniref:uncharacterized protein n=1 Tax=Humicola insolens TaxID=85995 RepID=UPI0037430BE3
MGQNLSLEEPFADTSEATLADYDRFNLIVMAIAWAGSCYGIGMIWCAVGLLRRWNGDRDLNLISVLTAILLSTGWPVILVYYALTGSE